MRGGPARSAGRDGSAGSDYDGLVSGARATLERLAATAVSWPPLSRVTGRLADLRLPGDSRFGRC